MKTDWLIDSLPELAVRISHRLLEACRDPSDPWRLPVLATQGMAGPEARVVVLREISQDKRELVVFSDRRAPKVRQVREVPHVALVFYDHDGPVQLRIRGSATVTAHPSPDLERWSDLTPLQRQNYQSLSAPGEIIESPPSASLGGPETGLENFAVLRISIHSMNWLWLARQGHRRANFDDANGQWRCQWVIP